MGCDCIPPPPLFDLPPPPDPTLIWSLISTEPEDALRRVRLQSCEFNPLFEFVGINGNFPGLVLFAAACLLAILCTVCSVTLCWQRLCSKNWPKRSPASPDDSCKFNSSADTIITNGVVSNWSTSARSPQMVVLPACSTSTSLHNFGRSQMGTVRLPGQRMPQPYFGRTASVRVPHDPASAYCTMSRHYEEIPVNYAYAPGTVVLPGTELPTSYSLNPVGVRMYEEPAESKTFLDRMAQNVDRKPPPTCRPPPPPEACEGTQLSRSCASSSDMDSVDAEIEGINRQQIVQSPTSRLSEFGGRESGYGTGPSRMWHHASPRAPPRSTKDNNNRSPPDGSVDGSPPSLTVYDAQKPMTYV